MIIIHAFQVPVTAAPSRPVTIVLDGPKDATEDAQVDEEARKVVSRELYGQALELHELVHKLHLMSLLAVCVRLSRLASHPLIQAAILSRLPNFQPSMTSPETVVGNLQSWFNETFTRVPSLTTQHSDPDAISSAMAAIAKGLSGSILSDLEQNDIAAVGATSLESQSNDETSKILNCIEIGQGPARDLTIIMTAACRALGINARLVSALNVTHLRPVGYAHVSANIDLC